MYLNEHASLNFNLLKSRSQSSFAYLQFSTFFTLLIVVFYFFLNHFWPKTLPHISHFTLLIFFHGQLSNEVSNQLFVQTFVHKFDTLFMS